MVLHSARQGRLLLLPWQRLHRADYSLNGSTRGRMRSRYVCIIHHRLLGSHMPRRVVSCSSDKCCRRLHDIMRPTDCSCFLSSVGYSVRLLRLLPSRASGGWTRHTPCGDTGLARSRPATDVRASTEHAWRAIRAVPGSEPGTSRTRSANHATRPNGRLMSDKYTTYDTTLCFKEP